MADGPARGIWRHWKGHPYQILFPAYLLPAPPRKQHLHLFDAMCSTNGPDEGRTLTVGVRDARPGASYVVAYPATGAWEPREGDGVVYVGLTLDGSPRPGHRVRVCDLSHWTGTAETPDGLTVPRFTFLGTEWHPEMAP